MTVVSVIQLVPHTAISSRADDFLAIDSVAFLISTLLSYWSIKHEDKHQNFERWADRIFLLGLMVMVAVSFLVAFELFKD